MCLKNLFTALLITVFTGTTTVVTAQSMQCKAFGKKRCDVDLGDYTSNGQLTVASLVPGESADLSMIFYSKQDYRIILCAEEHLGQLEFKILNSRGDVLFSNKDFDMVQDWDFSMTSTQRLIIQVMAPGSTSMGEAAEEGCLSLIIGHRQTPKKGFY